MPSKSLPWLSAETFDDLFDRHKPVVGIMDHKPYVSPNAYVAPSATILGNVMVGNRVSRLTLCVALSLFTFFFF